MTGGAPTWPSVAALLLGACASAPPSSPVAAPEVGPTIAISHGAGLVDVARAIEREYEVAHRDADIRLVTEAADLHLFVIEPGSAETGGDAWVWATLALAAADGTGLRLIDLSTGKGDIAIVDEAQPLGVAARRALERRNLVALATPRLRRFDDAAAVAAFLRDNPDAIGILSSPESHGLRAIADLGESIVLGATASSDAGRTLRAWLHTAAGFGVAGTLGYRPVPVEGTPATAR